MKRFQPRLQLDIAARDLTVGAVRSLIAVNPERHARRVLTTFQTPDDALTALSVRSAFDAYLATAQWPRGSEILVSALTIPDMPRIIREHGYVPVPVDLPPAELVPTVETIERALTSHTVAWLHAHLFGTRTDLAPLIGHLRARNVAVIEDCAQAFTGDAFRGAPGAAAVLFSFGTIKTATATGGAICRVADADHRARMAAHLAEWPRESRRRRAKKFAKTLVLWLVGIPHVYGRLVGVLQRKGIDPDAWAQTAAKGFPGDDFFTAIRHQPSAPLLAMMNRRLAQPTIERVRVRAASADAIARAMPPTFGVELGWRTPVRSHWVAAFSGPHTAELRDHLRAAGFDATARSSLVLVTGPRPSHTPEAERLLATILYIPIPATTHGRALERLTAAIADAPMPATYDPGPDRMARAAL